MPKKQKHKQRKPIVVVATSTSTARSSLKSFSNNIQTHIHTRNNTAHNCKTQMIISTYHILTKQHAQALARSDHTAAQQIQDAMTAMGGIDAYQKASLRGGDEKKGKGACGRWLVGWLRRGVGGLCVGRPRREGDRQGKRQGSEDGTMENLDGYESCTISLDCKKRKRDVKDHDSDEHHGTPHQPIQPPSAPSPHLIKLLDVGSVSGQTYHQESKWISATYIDLNPQNPNVLKQDFFERPSPTCENEKFHVVCLSLVLNFVGEPEKRGEIFLIFILGFWQADLSIS